MLNRKIYTTDVKQSSTYSRSHGYQVVTCRFKGIMRRDTYRELNESIADPNCSLSVIYNYPPHNTTFYADENVSILPVKQPEWSFNGTHKINIYTNIAYPVDNNKPPQKDEWIFNGTHKVNLMTKEAYLVVPERQVQQEWIFNGTHKINTFTKQSYRIDSVASLPPRDQWVFNGTHKVNLVTNEAYTYESSEPPTNEWIFNGTHKVNKWTNEAHVVPGNKKEHPTLQPDFTEYPDVFAFNGTHNVNYRTKEAYMFQLNIFDPHHRSLLTKITGRIKTQLLLNLNLIFKHQRYQKRFKQIHLTKIICLAKLHR